ncbi:GntR family transcriptional regulator [Micromonospora sp. NPDC049081]|uniref:GntR family transcriptional regulator n=1 Tax=Micromonospora sp. NPDC049081 TaxID=3155150 RepID=UPI0033C807B5
MPGTAASLAAQLREDIRTGKLPAGSKLPSISELMAQHDMGRGAVQQAVATLRAEGAIISRQGAASIVREQFARIVRESPDRLSRKQWGSGKAIQDKDTGNRWRDLDARVDEVPAPEYVAEPLGIEVGSPVVRRFRVFEVDGRRVQIAESHIPVDLARGTAIVYHDTGKGGVFARLAEQGWEPERFTERLVGRPPLPDEAELLRLPRNKAMVLEITRFAWSKDRCVDVTRMVLDAEAYEVVYNFDA